MNFQANSLTAGATYGSLDAAKAGKVNVSDSERLFEGCFEDSCLDSARADQGFEWEAGAGEKPLKLADEGLGGGDEDGQVADSVAGEERVGIDNAMQQGMYSSASPIDPLALRQFVSAGGDSLTVEESAKDLLLTGSSAKSAAPLASERAPVVSADAINLSKAAARMVQPVQLANSSFLSGSASSVLTATQTATSPMDPLTLRQLVSAAADPLTVEGSTKVSLLSGSLAKSAAPLASGHGPVPAMAVGSASGSAAASQGLEGESQKSDSTQSSLVQPNQQSKLGAAVASPRRSGVSEELASERAPVVSADAIKLPKTAARMVQPVQLANSSFLSGSASSVLTATQTATSPMDPLTLRQLVSAAADPLTVEGSTKVSLLSGSLAKSAAPLASGHGPVPAMAVGSASGSAAASQGLEGESQKSDSTQSSLVQPNQQSKLGAAVASPRRSGVSEELASERAPVVSADAIKLPKTAARMVQPVQLANSSFSSGSASSVLTTTQTAVSISGGSSKGGEGESQKGDPNSSSLLQTTQQVKVDAAALQKAENVRVFIHRIESAAHALRQETSNVVQLRVSLAGGEVIKLRLSLRGTKLKTLIQADHEQTRSMLRASWSEVSRSLAGKGIDAQNFEFEQSAGDGARKDQAFTGDDRNLPSRVSTGGFARSDSDTRQADLSTVVNERVQQLQFFSRIA